MRKRLLAIALSLLIVAGCLPQTASAATPITDQESGKADGKITGVTTAMEYCPDGQTADKPGCGKIL